MMFSVGPSAPQFQLRLLQHPPVLQLIMDSLGYWVLEMRCTLSSRNDGKSPSNRVTKPSAVRFRAVQRELRPELAHCRVWYGGETDWTDWLAEEAVTSEPVSAG
jgi:hypothetical protein